jgi:hypothetical protein
MVLSFICLCSVLRSISTGYAQGAEAPFMTFLCKASLSLGLGCLPVHEVK